MYDPKSGYPGAVVELAYQDVSRSLRWLKQVFGLRPVLRQPAEGEILHAEVETEFGAVVMLRRAAGDAPEPCGRSACKQVLVWVSDVDGHHAQAVAGGADILQGPITKPFGLRQYLVRDREGHMWEFTQHVKDVDPSEWGATTALDGSA
jgi:PhnB protein